MDAVLRPVDWHQPEGGGRGHLRLLDQTLLPDRVRVLQIETIDALVDAIHRLAVRGAPALGVAGAFGVALAAQNLDPVDVPAAVRLLRGARPTAVNLALGVDAAAAALPAGFDRVLEAAKQLRDDDIAACAAMARRGADELYRAFDDSARRSGLRLLTICNTGTLAAVERGTALGVIEEVFRDGHLRRALACETRPLLQGARLTAWELRRLGIPFDLLVDSAAAATMRSGLVDAVLTGADRIAANGDTANKIGTLSLAIAARYVGIPFFVVAPETTVDLTTPNGDAIGIEDRGSEEVCTYRAARIAPPGTTALNPAFDVTPAELITGIVTQHRVIRPATGGRPDGPVGRTTAPAAP